MASDEQNKITVLGIVIWLIGALFFLYEFFLRTFVGTVAQEIIPALHLNPESFALIGSAYYFAYALMQVPVGILADKFGVKKIMIFATLVCAGATFLFAHSTGFYTAIVSRLLMGFGSAFAFVCLLVIAVTWFPRRNFGFFAGASQFVGTMGPLLAGGPLVALMASSHGNWRVVLSEIGAFGIVLALLVVFIVRTKPRDGEQVLIFLKQPEQLSIRLKKLLKNKQAWYVALYSASVYVSIALLGAIWGTDYLQARGLSQGSAADMISLAWFGYAIGCPLLGAFSDLTKRRKPTLIACALLGLLVTIFITYMSFHHHYVYSILFLGLGLAAAGQNIGFAAISEHVDLATKATALGLNNGAITLFGAIIPPIVSFFIMSAAAGHTNNLVAHDFIIGFSFMPLLNVVALIAAAFLIKETYCKPQKEAIVLKVD